MAASSLPEPVKRPGIGRLSVAGKEFELERNDQLVRLFGANIVYSKSKSYDDVDLERELTRLSSPPAVILQGWFSIGRFKDRALQSLGLSVADAGDVPDIADFIPDVLLIRSAQAGDVEVLPDASRVPIDGSVETRLAIDIFDIKHTSEANPSYCAEIALYALMLANWLAYMPALKDRFFVTTSARLWTRIKQGDSSLERLEEAGGATPQQLLDALVADSEDANVRFYLASIRRFFEDVVRVIHIGDATSDAWLNLDWHVRSTCSSCDWLGDKRHLSRDQRSVVDANPLHYCAPTAESSGHLSLVPGITRGAKKILQRNSVADASALAAAAGHPALQQHTVLKREARNLPARAAAILAKKLSTDPDAVIASLASSAHLLVYVSVNFDSSSGLLTGLALSGTATAFVKGQSPRRFAAVPYVVDQKLLNAEWVALEAFLSQIAEYIVTVEGMVNKSITGQIHFWEERQFTELCNAIGRHLARVLDLPSRKAKALAWVFPPEELVATPESLEASTVVFVDEIVRRMVFTPTPHVVTLFDTAEHYPSGPVQSVFDSYYREYLSNGIPRERIYEIWSNTTQVTRGSTILPRNTVIAQFSDALRKQSMALESVCQRLRQDYKDRFKAKATHIPSSIPMGTTGVAFDGKLWVWWDRLEFNMSQLQAHIRLAMDGERLEATYEAIILSNGRPLSASRYEFDVAAGSTEAKYKDDSPLTLAKLGRPGMPLEHASKLLSPSSPAFAGSSDVLNRPLWSVLQATLVTLDRVNARATVDFTCYQEPRLVPYLFANSSVNLLTDVFLLEAKKPKPFDWSGFSEDILKEIGNPPIAAPDLNAANAMGIKPAARRVGSAVVTPAARVLWDASSLEKKSVIPLRDAAAIAAYVEPWHRLNPSQVAAVAHAAERALTVIWGPPGTGKTNTLAAVLHGLTHEAAVAGRPLKILVTGPNYKTVEEVMHRAAAFIAQDAAAPCSMFFGYSRTRTRGNAPDGIPNHVTYKAVPLDSEDADYRCCLAELSSNTGVVIVGCQVRQARRFPKALHSAFVRPVFDVVVIDESSQVTVSQALSALCGLKEDARLIVAGDQLQMPPISSIDPPADAAYLVGSIQTYLAKRKFAHPVETCNLEENYRSAEAIVAYARSIGYPPRLKAKHPNTTLHLLHAWPTRTAYPAHLPWCAAFNDLLDPEHKVITLLHEDEVSSQGNAFEASIVAGSVWMLRQSISAELDGRDPVTHEVPSPSDFWNKCVGIVTPHRAQRALVIKSLEKLFPTEKNLIGDAVDTVERFQGGERHTVFVTFGVADTEVIGGEEAFLMQLERTNVAVSRAMAKCIVVMPKTLATYIPEDKRALQTAFALKDYVEEFCNVRVDTTLTDLAHTRWAQVRYHQ